MKNKQILPTLIEQVVITLYERLNPFFRISKARVFISIWRTIYSHFHETRLGKKSFAGARFIA